MKTRIGYVATVVMVALSLIAGGRAEPRVFTSEQGKFSISMPGTPKEQTQNVDTVAGKIDWIMYVVEQDNAAYAASYADFPAHIVAASDPQHLLDGGIGGMVGNVNGKLLSRQNIDLDGYPGQEIVAEAKLKDPNDATLKSRTYLVNNRLYLIMVVALRGKVSSTEIDRFLQSFKLML
jgi:hypothetical protein